ncbi:hypothetical protein CAI21_01545 [Alkalilimnicola ehrlichii]|uniref:Phage holin family protein n=1 Tax=Alkalilimnicola ehrlichii TaxID=351052 RepID=A0A3E0X1M8_9GAMM|nr:phage holin family protein [Alkalilimnicola ehrlichii]RFA31339.1 hypothetical protein CAI21_01545 [Alkalilimnicola ehrlichii]RFA39387.1 hypothetical protein CAL65_00865 [Alkalilimnicola ehrlichii]
MTLWFSNLLALLACLTAAGRLLLFRRGERRYRFHWALLAWLLIDVYLIVATQLVWGIWSQNAFPWLATLLLGLLALQTFRAGGNVAKLGRLKP